LFSTFIHRSQHPWLNVLNINWLTSQSSFTTYAHLCDSSQLFNKKEHIFKNSRLEADRISFSFYFSAPENAFFYFSAFYFSAEKDIRIFVFFSFSVLKWP